MTGVGCYISRDESLKQQAEKVMIQQRERGKTIRGMWPVLDAAPGGMGTMWGLATLRPSGRDQSLAASSASTMPAGDLFWERPGPMDCRARSPHSQAVEGRSTGQSQTPWVQTPVLLVVSYYTALGKLLPCKLVSSSINDMTHSVCRTTDRFIDKVSTVHST